MTELDQKYGCFKVDKIEDRCIKVASTYDGETFSTLKDCTRNCNTPEEQEKLDKLKEHFRLKTTIEFIRPKLIDTFDRMNDLPILNFDGKIYNRKLLNFDEIQLLYIILNSRKKFVKHRNLFLEDIVSSLNGQIGLDMTITTVETTQIKISKPPVKEILIGGNPETTSWDVLPNIIYKLDLDKKYVFHFLSDEYKELFDKEIKSFYESNNIYLIKNVHIEKFEGGIGHHTQVLIKKNITSDKTKLEAFVYDPVSNSIINPISEKIEEFLNSQIKYEHSVFNLSKIYGIQDFEESNGDDYMKFIIKHVETHVVSIIYSLNYLMKDFKNQYLEYKRTNIPFSPKAFTKFIMNKFFSKLFERHFLINDIKSFFRDLLDSILINEKKYLEDSKYEFIINDSKLKNIVSKFSSKSDNLITEIAKLHMKKTNLIQKINNQYNFDFFEGNCYLWSYYTVILILINPTIKPYDIIKASYYQSSKIGKMQKIFNETLDKIDFMKNELEYVKTYFDQDYIKNQNLKFEKHNIKVEKNKLNVDFLEHTRLVYIKITNLILINILYNRFQNKYLLYSIERGCQGDICEKKMIPEKVNEILDKLSFDETKLTKESILEIIKRGKKINIINSAILKDKSTVPNDYEELYFEPRMDPLAEVQKNIDSPSSKYVKPEVVYLEKYLKYKKKYLQLKNQLNINKN